MPRTAITGAEHSVDRAAAAGGWQLDALSQPGPNFSIRSVAIVAQDVVDIMLLSASNLEKLAGEGVFQKKPAVKPAIRANDTTDIWVGARRHL